MSDPLLCPTCGASMVAGDRFCEACGADLHAVVVLDRESRIHLEDHDLW